MIIFINGSFGVGKSSVAELLVSKVHNSMIFDAEEVGYMLRRVIPPSDFPDDFQDLAAWRTLTIQTAKALKEQYHKTLIMPMCIWKERYFDNVIPALQSIDNDFYHFCLTAERETILKRLKERKDPDGVMEWATERLDKCLVSYQSEKFETKITTENRNLEEIIEEVLLNIKA